MDNITAENLFLHCTSLDVSKKVYIREFGWFVCFQRLSERTYTLISTNWAKIVEVGLYPYIMNIPFNVHFYAIAMLILSTAPATFVLCILLFVGRYLCWKDHLNFRCHTLYVWMDGWMDDGVGFSSTKKRYTLTSLRRMQWPIFVKLGMWVVVDTSTTHVVVVCRHRMCIFNTSYLFWLANNKKRQVSSILYGLRCQNLVQVCG